METRQTKYRFFQRSRRGQAVSVVGEYLEAKHTVLNIHEEGDETLRKRHQSMLAAFANLDKLTTRKHSERYHRVTDLIYAMRAAMGRSDLVSFLALGREMEQLVNEDVPHENA